MLTKESRQEIESLLIEFNERIKEFNVNLQRLIEGLEKRSANP